MSEKLGIKELKELLDLPLSVVSVINQAKADGKIDIMDLGLLLQLVPKLGPALADDDKIPSELADLDAEEAAELVALIVADLSVSDEKAKQVIDASFKMLVAAFNLVKAVKA